MRVIVLIEVSNHFFFGGEGEGASVHGLHLPLLYENREYVVKTVQTIFSF